MSIFDDKVYGFLTHPDNWQFASEITEKMNAVKYQLPIDFWTAVKQNIETKLNLAEWEVEMTSVHETNSHLVVRHSTWNKLFSIAFESLHKTVILGVCRDFNSKKIPDDLHKQIGIDLKNIYSQMSIPDDWWCGYFYTGDNFGEWVTLGKILPANKKVTVDRYTAMMFELVTKARPVIENAINKMHGLLRENY